MNDDRFGSFEPQYTRRLKDDRPSFLDKLFWTHENHPAIERVLIGVVVLCISALCFYNAYLAAFRAAKNLVAPW